MFNLFRLYENEILERFSMSERRKIKHKFGKTKVFNAEGVRKSVLNSKFENKVFC